MTFGRRKAWRALIAVSLGLTTGSAGAETITPLSEPEPGWPPVANASFRADLLSTLSRTAPNLSDGAVQLTDFTEPVLNNWSFAPYCYMSLDLRRKFKSFENARLLPEYAREMSELFRRECRVRVFVRAERKGKIFVVVYPKAAGPARPYTSHTAGLALAITKGAGMSVEAPEVGSAARAASQALRR